jgi:peroxin-1
VKFLAELSTYSVGILAIAESVTALHKSVMTGHSFSKTISLKPPNKDTRVKVCFGQWLFFAVLMPSKILRRIVKDLPAVLCDDSDPINYTSIATRTEGYSPQDLLDLTNRALYKATIRMANDLEGKVRFDRLISGN